MIGWFELAILSAVLFGIQNFLYKSSAVKKYNSFIVTFASTITVAIASIIFFFTTRAKILDLKFLLLISFLPALFTVINPITKIEGLRYIPTSIFYPVIKSSLVFVLLASILIFREVVSIKEWIGIILIIFVIYIVSIKEKKHKIENLKLGLFFALGCALVNALSSIINKFAVARVNYNNFLGMTYIYAIFLSLIFMNLFKTKEKKERKIKQSLMMGLVIGIFIFTGFLADLKALKDGPIGIVVPITTLSIVIPIILGAIVYKEKMTLKRTLAVILSIVAVIILKI